MRNYLHGFVALAGEGSGHGAQGEMEESSMLAAGGHGAREDRRGGGAGAGDQRSMAGTREASRARLQSDTVSTWLHPPWIEVGGGCTAVTKQQIN